MIASPNVVEIAGRKIGGNNPCFLIAEVGTTCLGDMDKAKKLIRASKEAGMDAVKFQMIDPEQISDKSVTYNVVHNGKTESVNMYEWWKRLKFSEEQWREIIAECKKLDILFFTTVDYVEGVDVLERLGAATHKIGAWDTTFRQLIERVGRTRKPMFVDLGPTTRLEVEELVSWYRAAGGTAVLFMHDFHTSNDAQMNLRTVQHLNQSFPWPAGFSSPAMDNDIDMAALALGSAYLEKRLILSRSEKAFHAHESMEPAELKDWVTRIRHVERALGKVDLIPSDRDVEMGRLYYRSVFTSEAELGFNKEC
jgi:sialic acid synthase SpsE